MFEGKNVASYHPSVESAPIIIIITRTCNVQSSRSWWISRGMFWYPHPLLCPCTEPPLTSHTVEEVCLAFYSLGVRISLISLSKDLWVKRPHHRCMMRSSPNSIRFPLGPSYRSRHNILCLYCLNLKALSSMHSTYIFILNLLFETVDVLLCNH